MNFDQPAFTHNNADSDNKGCVGKPQPYVHDQVLLTTTGNAALKSCWNGSGDVSDYLYLGLANLGAGTVRITFPYPVSLVRFDYRQALNYQNKEAVFRSTRPRDILVLASPGWGSRKDDFRFGRRGASLARREGEGKVGLFRA